MATRRPPMPKAQYTASLSNPSGKVLSAAPVVDAEPVKAGAPADRGKDRAKDRERQTTTGPTSRNAEDGVVYSAGISPVPARSFSGRLLVLGLAMGAVTLLLAPNVHTYLQQRAEISDLRDDIAAKETQQDVYAAELKRWDDPAYIKQQARDRVSMLMPGETGYWVYGANGVEALDNTSDAAKVVAAVATTAKNATAITVEPWVAGLWDAVQKSAEVHSGVVKPVPAPEPAG